MLRLLGQNNAPERPAGCGACPTSTTEGKKEETVLEGSW